MSINEDASSPTVAKVFGIIHIVYASIMVLFTVYSLVMMFTGPVMPEGTPGAEEIIGIQKELMGTPKVQVFMITSIVISLALIAVLFVAGLKLLKKQLPGRTLSLFYAWAGVVSTILSTVLYHLIVHRTYEELLLSSSLEQQMVDGMMMVAKFQPLFMLCCGAVYPVILLIFMMPEKFARSLTGPAE